MRISRRVACVAVAAVGLISLAGAGTATAASPEWLIEGSELSLLVPNEASIKGNLVPEVEFTLKGTIAGAAFATACTEETNTGKIKVTGKGERTLKFAKCKTTAPAGCKMETFTMTAKTQLAVNAGRLFNVFEPAVAPSFGNVKVEGCASAGTYPLKGKVCGENNPPGNEAEVELSLFTKEVDERCSNAGLAAGLTLGGQPAELEGANAETLTGAYLNQKWGGQ